MSYASTIAADAPLSWHRMGDTNATLLDSSGNAHDGTYTGTPGTDYTQAQTGLVGDTDKAVLFQGTNAGCAQYTYSVSVGTGDFSVEVWAKPAGTGTLVLWSTSSFWLGVASGVLTLSGATGGALTHQTALATGTKYHVVLTRAGGVMTLTLNTVACTTPQTDTTSLTGNLMQTVAGLGGSGFEFNGVIDEVAFYAGVNALTPTKISAHYAAGTGGAFAPSSLSGLALWLASDTGLYQDTGGTTPAAANNDPVGLWQYPGGVVDSVNQATAGARPKLATAYFNGHPAVVFDGAATFLSRASVAAIAGASGATLFLVHASSSLGTVFQLSGFQVDANGGVQNSVWSTLGNYSYANDVDRSTVPKTLAARFDGSQSTDAAKLHVWLSGALESLTFPGNPLPATLQAAGTLYLGAQNGANQYQLGPTFEVILYDRALTDPEVAQVHAYVASKWFAGLPSSVVCGGDSLTVSYPNNATPWALRLGTLLGSGWTVPNPNTISTAETAAQVQRVADLAAANGDTRAQHYRPQDWYCLWAGTNDLYAGATGAATFTALQNLANARKSQRLRVFACTVIDRSDTPPAGYEAERSSLNASIRSAAGPSGPWEFVVDLAADSILGTAAATNDPTYSNNDGAHLNQAGSDRVADLVYAGFQAFNSGDTAPPTLAGPTVPGPGSTLTATLSEAGCVPASGTGGFSISGTAATVASWAVSGTTLTLTLTGLVQAGETVTLSYDRATTSNDVADAAGNFLANVTAAAVTNNSTQGGTTATATFSTTHAAVLRCGQINPGYTAGRAADELISLGSGYDFTVTNCTALSVPFFLAASAGMTVSVDGGTATALTMPATGSWADVVVFSGLASTAHTVSLRLTSGSRMLAVDAVNSFQCSNVGSATAPTISATKAGPVYPVGKATFRRNASVDGAVVLVPSLNTGTYNAPLLDLPAYVGQRVAFQSDATELRFFMAGHGQTFSFLIDGVVTGAQVTVPNDGLNEWRTVATGLDGANHTYAVQNDLPGMYLLYSLQTVGGTLTTHAFPAAGNLVVYGNSISVAAGTSRASKGYAAQVARAKNRRLLNLAVSGSAVSSSVDVGRPGLITEFAGDYLNWVSTGWDTSQDEVLILAGFNDSNYIDDLTAFTNAYSLALDGLAATGATVRVLGYLDTAAAQASANRTAWNSALSSLVSGLGLARITYHDTTGWITPASDCVDGIHLNQSGDDKVATQVGAIVTAWTAPSGGGTYTAASNVRSGTDRGDGTVGTLVVPPANKVVTGTVFDNGTVGSANVLSVLITTP